MRRALLLIGHVVLVTPFLVLLFWAHYPLQVFLGIVVPPFITAASLMAIYVTLCVAAIVSQAVFDATTEYGELGRALQLHPRKFARRIALPVAANRAGRVMLIVAIATIQMTMFSSLIGVDDLFRAAQRVNSEISRPILVFTAMASLYLLVCTPLYFLVQRVKPLER
jgi:ABC-type amino acid transport system permease subunit